MLSLVLVQGIFFFLIEVGSSLPLVDNYILSLTKGTDAWATILCKKNRPGLSNFRVRGRTIRKRNTKEESQKKTPVGISKLSRFCLRMLLRGRI